VSAREARPAGGARRRVVVGISGATGVVYGVRLLEALRALEVETHLVVSGPGELTREYETDLSAAALRALATASYRPNDVGAAIASGSFRTLGMVVAPCSMRSLAEIASGATSNLLTRAADVTLKERRPLILLARETPLSLVHLRAMVAATEAGAVIAPPVPAFYTRPKTIDDLVDHTVGRLLDLLGLDNDLARRWGEEPSGTRDERARGRDAGGDR
jgi:4-hydroxy-3-polyprenylbenzoate decarboxylase